MTNTNYKESENNETLNLKKIIINYLKDWKVFLVMFLISFSVAIAYLIIYPTTYEIASTIQLEEDKTLGSGSMGLGEAAGLMKSFGLGSLSASAVNVDNELVKLSSNHLLKKVILELGLNVNYLKPGHYNYYMYEEQPFLLRTDSVTNEMLDCVITFDVSVKDGGQIVVKTKALKEKKEFTFSSLPATISLKQGDFILSRANEHVKPYSMTIEFSPATWVAEYLAEDIEIEEYTKNSTVIEFLYADYEKKRGVDLLNTLMRIYNEQEDAFKKEEGNKSITFLDQRIEDVVTALSDAEYKIEKYKTANQLTSLEYDVVFYAEQMQVLQLKIIELEAQLHVINLMDTYVKDPANKYNLVPSLISTGEGGEKGSAIMVYNEALVERARVLQSSGYDNPLISSLDVQLDQLRNGVYLAISNTRESAELTLNDLKTKENALLSKMRAVPELERDYIDFKRQQEIFQAVYLILLQKREEIALSVGESKNRARILDHAYVKKKPVAPRKLFALIGIFLFTILIPMGYIFIRQQLADLKAEYIKSKKE